MKGFIRRFSKLKLDLGSVDEEDEKAKRSLWAPLIITISPHMAGLDYFLEALREEYNLFSPQELAKNQFESISVADALQFWGGDANSPLKLKLKMRSSSNGESIADRLASPESAEVMFLAQYFSGAIGFEELNLRLEQVCSKQDADAHMLRDVLINALAAILSNTSEEDTRMQTEEIQLYIPDASEVVACTEQARSNLEAAAKKDRGLLVWSAEISNADDYAPILRIAAKYHRVVRFIRWGQELQRQSLSELVQHNIMQFLKFGRYYPVKVLSQSLQAINQFIPECEEAERGRTHVHMTSLAGYEMDGAGHVHYSASLHKQIKKNSKTLTISASSSSSCTNDNSPANSNLNTAAAAASSGISKSKKGNTKKGSPARTSAVVDMDPYYRWAAWRNFNQIQPIEANFVARAPEKKSFVSCLSFDEIRMEDAIEYTPRQAELLEAQIEAEAQERDEVFHRTKHASLKLKSATAAARKARAVLTKNSTGKDKPVVETNFTSVTPAKKTNETYSSQTTADGAAGGAVAAGDDDGGASGCLKNGAKISSKDANKSIEPKTKTTKNPAGNTACKDATVTRKTNTSTASNVNGGKRTADESRAYDSRSFQPVSGNVVATSSGSATAAVASTRHNRDTNISDRIRQWNNSAGLKDVVEVQTTATATTTVVNATAANTTTANATCATGAAPISAVSTAAAATVDPVTGTEVTVDAHNDNGHTDDVVHDADNGHDGDDEKWAILDNVEAVGESAAHQGNATLAAGISHSNNDDEGDNGNGEDGNGDDNDEGDNQDDDEDDNDEDDNGDDDSDGDYQPDHFFDLNMALGNSDSSKDAPGALQSLQGNIDIMMVHRS